MSEQFDYVVEQRGHRLDQLVAEIVLVSRVMAQRLIEHGDVTVNGKAKTKNYRVNEGDFVSVTVPQSRPLQNIPQDIPLDILYEDDSMLVVNKPRGMVVHPGAGNQDGTLVNALLAYCGDTLSGINGVLRPGIVHRLDKDTSGLLMVAKTDEAHHSLSAQLQTHSVDRRYQAVVHGRLASTSGSVDAPIGRHSERRKEMAIIAKGKNAFTEYRTVRSYIGFTHVACILATGRTHQIRVHMSHLGHPVAGDPVYGPAKKALAGGQCLHAANIAFSHPKSGQRIQIESALPDYFLSFLSTLQYENTV